MHPATAPPASVAATRPPIAPQPTVVKPEPPPVAVVPQISQQQQEVAAVKKVIGSDKLYDISLDQKATSKQIEAAIDEQLKRNGYKPHEFSKERAGYIVDTFNSDVEHLYKLKSKLETAKAGSQEEAVLKQSILAYQARCRSWKTLYIGANYTHDGIIRNFNTQIQRVCAD